MSLTATAERLSERLPEDPWHRLDEHRRRALSHPEGLIDLSKAVPVDPVPEIVQEAVARATSAPGYPATAGTPALRAAVAGWLARRHRAEVDPAQILPTSGSKELLTLLPTLLGLGPGDAVVHPELAYAGYATGATLAGAASVAHDEVTALSPALPTGQRVRLVWINSPANPTGRVRTVAQLRDTVRWARAHNAVVASDECYLDLGWEKHPRSVLDPAVTEGSHRNLLAVHSLSKRSNLAGYRAGFVTGDPRLIAELLLVRRRLGLIPSTPAQTAMTAALTDDTHVTGQRRKYAARRATLRAAFESTGWHVESEAGLFLWAIHPSHNAWTATEHLAAHGILVTPGDLYGPAGKRHIRIAITATDDRVDAVADRLTAKAALQ